MKILVTTPEGKGEPVMLTELRKVTTHKVNAANDQIEITAIETPTNEPIAYKVTLPYHPNVILNFQMGPIKESGVNGLTNEALMAIVLDRLNFFQSGAFKCRENALAITNIEQGLLWLHKRTWDRQARGIEGTLTV